MTVTLTSYSRDGKAGPYVVRPLSWRVRLAQVLRRWSVRLDP